MALTVGVAKKRSKTFPSKMISDLVLTDPASSDRMATKLAEENKISAATHSIIYNPVYS
jgi:hypothetical protein